MNLISSYLRGYKIRKDPTNIKLGFKRSPNDPRTLLYKNYGQLPLVPSSLMVTRQSKWDLLGNDLYGDCVEADMGHESQIYGQTISLSDVLDAYHGITGFNINDPASDQGTNWLDALKYWKAIGIGGHRIDGYMGVNPKIYLEMREATYLFGGLHLGLNLPLSAQAQTGKLWQCKTGPNAKPGSWGGHAVPIIGYSRTRIFVITWGMVQAMTNGFFNTYCDEAWATLSGDWASRMPNGFNLAQLQADLLQFT